MQTNQSMQAGNPNPTIRFWAINSSTNNGFTGLVFNTSGLKVYYARQNAGSNLITMVTGGAVGTWVPGTIVPVDATNMPGLYDLDLPAAAVAPGVQSFSLNLSGVTGMNDVQITVMLDKFPPAVVAQNTSPGQSL